MVVCSAAALGLSANTFVSSVQGVGALVGLLAASIVVIIAISPSLGKGSPYRNESIYTITVASVTLAVVLAHIAERRADTALRGYRVAARRKNLGDTRGLEILVRETKGRAQPGTAGANDDHIVIMIDELVVAHAPNPMS